MKLIGLRVMGAATLACLLANSAQANSYGFVNITGGMPDVAGQLSVAVSDEGPGKVLFTFHNEGPISSTITEIYFDDGTLLGISEIRPSGAGVVFSRGGQNGVNPADLPGGETVTPAFEATQLFSTEVDGKNSLGVDPGESVGILFDLILNKTYDDAVDALADGSLRIGLHVRSIGPEGISDSFVNNGPTTSVPDGGASVMLLGLALVGVQGLRRKR